MNAKRLITLATAALLAPATQALAEAGPRQDNSQFLVWAFLGMCRSEEHTSELQSQ